MAITHLAVPFRLGPDGQPVTVVQDTIDDIAGCVTVLCNTPQGERLDLPDYGIPDQTFAQGEPSVAVVQAAIADWEPRANATVTATPGPQGGLQVTVAAA